MIHSINAAFHTITSRLNYSFIAIFLFIGVLLSVWLGTERAEAFTGTNVAKNKTATASCSSGIYSPAGAVDDSIAPTSRWYCSTGISGDPLWLKVDLGSVHVLNGYSVIGMGELGNGWGPDLNPKNFRVQQSNDGSSWTDVDAGITDNSSSVVDRNVSFTARYVRLYIDYGNQFNHTWASVMEFKVYGYEISSNAALSGLTISSGTLSPSFAAGTTSYTANVANSVSSLDVTPTLADGNATVEVNGSAATSGSAESVPLAVGSNTITVLVSAQDGTTQQTYTVTVTRAPSSNAALSALTISSGSLNPTFAAGTTSYTASVANSVTTLDVTPTLADGNASIEVNGSAATSGSTTSVPLAVGSNTITVLVIAQDGTTQQTYTVTVTRAPSSNAALSALTISSGTLSPTFAAGTTSYTASVANSVGSLDVTQTLADETASVEVNGSAATSGSTASVPLIVGSNTITVLVSAQDGTTQQTYTVTVTRAPSSNAALSALTISSGSLNPTFAAGTTSYTASVANSVTTLDVTPTLADGTATVEVNGSAATSGSAKSVPLAVGSNTITVLVSAQDGTTQKTYTVTVTRAPSSNADLSALTISSGILSPGFASGTFNYSVNVANSVYNMNVTSTLADGTASLKINGSAVTSGNASSVPLAVGSNTITVLVIAQDGTTQQTYTVTVTRAPSSNAALSALTISSGILSPSFASGTFNYSVNVANSVYNMNVTPILADVTASVKINGSAVTSGNPASVPLVVGSNTITVLVTAQDGTTKLTYTITAVRAPNSNAELIALTTSSGTLSPTFSPGVQNYSVTVANAVYNFQLFATAADPEALIAIKANGHSVTGATYLEAATTTFQLQVSASDSITNKLYTVDVNKFDSDFSSIAFGQTSARQQAYEYRLEIGYEYNKEITLQVSLFDPQATFTVTGATYTATTMTLGPLTVGTHSFPMTVTSPNGVKTTYQLVVVRTGSPTLSYIDKNGDGVFDTRDVTGFATRMFDANLDGLIDVDDLVFMLSQLPSLLIK